MDKKVLPFYLKYILEGDYIQNKYFKDTAGAAIQNVASVKVLKGIKLPLPSLAIQKEVVAEIETEQAIVKQNEKLIELFKAKIQDTIAAIWGK
jgi:restriction endonuclease S subunit